MLADSIGSPIALPRKFLALSPELFHFNVSWDAAMQSMGLQVDDKVFCGRFNRREVGINVPAARKKEECSCRIYPPNSSLPSGKARVGQILTQIF
jgi:hypothetical protein